MRRQKPVVLKLNITAGQNKVSCRVTDNGRSRQVWKATANILNTQQWAADKGGPPASGFGQRL